ncbi:RNA polymerase II largest subunit [Anopheles sinensis]|uniref:RNA polymerase II largest subunit n=1 Tax=Anopheles sinensis TaxID=74873 RepID=A0A084VHQ6_ANOSI|nr:RNA polymerase II largest subunit [Anopheles sinensis]
MWSWLAGLAKAFNSQALTTVAGYAMVTCRPGRILASTNEPYDPKLHGCGAARKTRIYRGRSPQVIPPPAAPRSCSPKYSPGARSPSYYCWTGGRCLSVAAYFSIRSLSD